MAKNQLVLIECDAYEIATGNLVTLRWASAKYTSKAADSPALTTYLNCVTKRPNFVRTLHGEGKTFGPAGDVGAGTFELGNGWVQALQRYRLDFYKTTYRFNHRAVRVYLLDNSRAALSTKTMWAQGRVVGDPEWGENTVTFNFASREAELAGPVLTSVYGGNNGVAGQIVDGTSEMAGTYVQRIWGNPRDCPGQLVNSNLVIFKVGDAFKLVEQIREQGLVTFTIATTVANATALASLTLTTTQAAGCPTQGLIRLGWFPAGEMRFDLQTDSSIAGDMIANIVQTAGWSGGDLTAGTVSALNALDNSPLQLVVTDGQKTVAECLDDILSSIGGHRIHERIGTMTLGVMVAPSTAASVKTITGAKSGDLQIRQSADTNLGLPPWRTMVNWYKRWSPLARADFAAGASIQAINDQMQPSRAAVALSSAVRDANPLSDTFPIDTLQIASANAQAFASSQQALRGVAAGRDFFVVPLPLHEHTDLDPGDVIQLKRNRFDMTGGKPLVITTMTEDLEEDQTQMEAFG